MKSKWKTYIDRTTGNTVIIVENGENKLTMELSPYSMKTKTPKELSKMVQRLQDAIELY